MVTKIRFASPDEWKAAKCRNTRPAEGNDPFFDESEEEEAIAFCNGEADGNICPVRDQCLLYAMVNGCKEGVWGGTSALTRKALRRRFPSKKTGEPRPEWEWMSEEDALTGLNPQKLRQELNQEIIRD